MSFPRKQIKANARAALSANYWPIVGYPFLLGLLLEAALSVFFTVVIVALLAVVGFSAGLEGLFDGSAGVGFLVGFYIIYMVSIVIICLFMNVITVGELKFYYEFYRGSKGDFGTFFEGFKNHRMWRIIGGMFLMALKLMLWPIPGYILMLVGIVMAEMDTMWVILAVVGGILYFAGCVMTIIKGYQYRMIPYLLIDRPDLTIKECFKMTKQMTDGYKGALFVMDLSFIGWVLLSLLTCGILIIFYVGPYIHLAEAGCYDFLKRTRMGQPGPRPGQPMPGQPVPGPQQFGQGYVPNGVDNANQGPVFQSASFEPQAPAQNNFAQPVETVAPQQPSFEQPVEPVAPQQPSFEQPVETVAPEQPSYEAPVEPAQPEQTFDASSPSGENTYGPKVVENDDIFDE
ncbi:Uncharacterized membrane protein [Pseudobutyrivibrio sp. YE44]|uniref:DUF975 family protein n=1 Tax=Pseudobutyrivibrio sp. YE44 TaxID=1520802 RepID=UPI0008890781|nr:DUF975 family protein [Pseudobutyrivibrio sp. YE44]SDB40992.1 Uncharacterized membrane protein [Pseudobutyrivibrio sp. YE44]